MKQFKAPKESLGDLDAKTAATLLAAAADVALVVDRKGVIVDLSFDAEAPSLRVCADWLGKRWIDTVTVESRSKVEDLLRTAAAKTVSTRRHVNHPSPSGADLPVLYVVVPLRRSGKMVALGRDLQAIAALQQRLVDAQQSLEHDLAQLRHAEMRYRLLFRLTSEAVLIVDAATHKVVEANPAAGERLGAAPERLLGRSFPEGLDEESARAIETLLAGVRATGRGDDVRARLADGSREFLISAFLFRQDESALFLIRLTPLEADAGADVVPKAKSKLLKVVEKTPDGFVVTGPDGRILSANAAFLDLAQLATEAQARHESLERWLGRPGVDLAVLIANLRQHGSIRLFATTLRGEYGAVAEVEISATSVLNGGQPCFGFAIRNIARRLPAELRSGRELPRSVDQLTELIGRVPLKELVRETTDVIERMCIEAALELTGDNRASAAEMLGLSRQSLYVKLRRYGLAEATSDDDER